MSYGYIGGLPGVHTQLAAGYQSAVIQKPEFLVGGGIIDGTLTYAINNGTDNLVILAGTLMKQNAAGAFQPFIPAKTTASALSSATTVTVGVAGAQAIYRAFGSTGAGTLTALTTGSYVTVTVTAIDLVAGTLTCSALSAALENGAPLLFGTVTASNAGGVLAFTGDSIGVWVSDFPNTIANPGVGQATSWGAPVTGGFLGFNRIDNAPTTASSIQAFKTLVQAMMPRMDINQTF